MLQNAFLNVLMSSDTLGAFMEIDLNALIQKAQKGDKESFSKLYQHFYKKIYRYLFFQIRDEELCKDFCQDTFVKAWKSLAHFSIRKNGTFQAFLFTIARNLVIDHARKKKEVKIEEFESIPEEERLYEDIASKEEVAQVRMALDKLTEEERQIIVLKYFEEMSGEEIAKVLSMKEGAVRVRIHRIIEKLKIYYEIDYGRKN